MRTGQEESDIRPIAIPLHSGIVKQIDVCFPLPSRAAVGKNSSNFKTHFLGFSWLTPKFPATGYNDSPSMYNQQASTLTGIETLSLAKYVLIRCGWQERIFFDSLHLRHWKTGP